MAALRGDISFRYLKQFFLVYLLPGLVYFMSGVTHIETAVLFFLISKLMFTNCYSPF